MHHRIEYPNGTVHEGRIDHRNDTNALGIKSLEGLRVLDIATNDGYFAFWAEQLGAAEVVAIDVGNYRDYDWGFDGPKEKFIESLTEQNKWEHFDFHHANLKSKVIKKEMSVYDIEMLGEFDVVLNYGLLYHLRNPVLALDKCRKVCRGFAVVETESHTTINPYLPVCIEGGYWTGIGSVTDTYFPTHSCIASWMKKACFEYNFAQRRIYSNRATVIGVVDRKYLPWFEHHEHCDGKYWRTVQKTVSALFPK